MKSNAVIIAQYLYRGMSFRQLRDIDDILCIGKGNFAEHINQLKEIFRRFQKSGLKVNASKCSFGLKEIPYLGYVIIINGIKPDPKKF